MIDRRAISEIARELLTLRARADVAGADFVAFMIAAAAGEAERLSGRNGGAGMALDEMIDRDTGLPIPGHYPDSQCP
jgi:hypothetical protein